MRYVGTTPSVKTTFFVPIPIHWAHAKTILNVVGFAYSLLVKYVTIYNMLKNGSYHIISFLSSIHF